MVLPSGPGSVPRSSLSMGEAYWIGTLIWVALGGIGYAIATFMNKEKTTRS